MLLDVCDWDHAKVQALYAKSATRRRELEPEPKPEREPEPKLYE